MILDILGDALAIYLIISFLVFCDSDSDDPKHLRSLAEGLMWPVTLYKACKAYVKDLDS